MSALLGPCFSLANIRFSYIEHQDLSLPTLKEKIGIFKSQVVDLSL